MLSTFFQSRKRLHFTMEKLEKEFPQVTKVTAKRKNGVRYNTDRGFIYTKQKTT